MDATTRNLIWREVRERRTQAAVCLLWMIGGALYCIAYEWTRRFRAPAASFFTTAALYAFIAPIFLAMRTSLGETTDRTRSFSDGLPISPRRRGWVRLVGGASVLVVPIVVGAVLLSICLATGWLEQMQPRPPEGSDSIRVKVRECLSGLGAVGLVGCVTAVVAWSATCFYLIVSLVGTKLRAESHVGYCGAAVAMLWFLASGLRAVFDSLGFTEIAAWSGAVAPEGLIVNYGYGDARGTYGDLSISHAVTGPLLINAGLQFALAVMFVRGYCAKFSKSAGEPSLRGARRVWWKPKLHCRAMALVWLALRQSVPMCLPGLVIACLMTLFQMDHFDHPGETVVRQYSDSMPSAMWAIGILWSAVVGAGVFSAEIDWRTGEFWRTRPISPGQLFGVKFVGGLLVVLLVLDGTVIAVGWNSPYWGDYDSMNWPYVACFVPLHATMFALAVAWTCLLRRAVLGGMAAIATYTLSDVVLEWFDATRSFDPVAVYNESSFRNRSQDVAIVASAQHYLVVATAMGLILVASMLIGWLALRRYDPRRLAG